MDHAYHTETVNGCTINVYHEPRCNFAPHRDYEGFSPMVVQSPYGTETWGLPDDVPSLLTPDQFALHWRELAEACDLLPHRVHAEIRSMAEDSHPEIPWPMADDYAVYFTQTICNKELTSAAILDAYAACLKIAGVPHHRFTRHGYVQGQSLEFIVFHHDAFREHVGSPAYDPESDDPKLNGHDDMSADADTHAAWAHGDTWYYVVTDEDGETIDSCGGFIGAMDSDEWNYMINQAREAADGHSACELAA